MVDLFTKATSFVTSCLLICTLSPSEKGSTLKGKDLLPIFRREIKYFNRVVSPECVSILLQKTFWQWFIYSGMTIYITLCVFSFKDKVLHTFYPCPHPANHCAICQWNQSKRNISNNQLIYHFNANFWNLTPYQCLLFEGMLTN